MFRLKNFILIVVVFLAGHASIGQKITAADLKKLRVKEDSLKEGK